MMTTSRFDTSVPVDERRGPLKQMYSGRMIHLLDLRPEDVDAADIAHHLSIFNRWTGGTIAPLSVAQHSLLVSEEAEQLWATIGGGGRFGRQGRLFAAVYGLLHDAAEAYMGDICRPLKAALSALAPGVIEGIEKSIDAAIFAHFGLPPVMPPEVASVVKRADNIVTSTEGRDMLQAARQCDPGADWRTHMPPPRLEYIRSMHWRAAKTEFMIRLLELTEGGY